jgi:hypothetical protein
MEETKRLSGDRIYSTLLFCAALCIPRLLILIATVVAIGAWPALRTFGFEFLTSSEWDPVNGKYGAAPAVYGTLVTSFLALLIATPLAVGAAIFLSEFAPGWLRQPVAFMIDLLAAIPSVVFGLWGIFVLVPFLRTFFMPFLRDTMHLGSTPLFSGPAYGPSMLAAQGRNPMSRLTVTLLAAASAFTVVPAQLHAQAPAPAAAPNVRVTNTAFLNYFVSLSDTIAHANNFDVARAYINVLGKFDNGISTRVTADIYRPADGTLTYRLKYAYGAWTPNNGPITLKLGAIQTPWLDFEETLWDYRFQGPVVFDRAGYMTSSDLGAGIDGSYGMDRFNFQATVVNGEGYSRPGGDEGKDIMARASLRLVNTDDSSRVGGLRASGYAQYGKKTLGGPRNRFIGMVSYRSRMLTLAAEAGATKDRLSNGSDADGSVLSAFGVAHLGATPWSVIARVDHVDPNTDADNDAFTTFIAGPSYQLAKQVRLLLDVDHSAYQQELLPADVQVAKTRLMLHALVSF